MVILCLCIVGAIVLSFANLNDDFVELKNFYKGYMGRKLLLHEGRLVYKDNNQRTKTKKVLKQARF